MQMMFKKLLTILLLTAIWIGAVALIFLPTAKIAQQLGEPLLAAVFRSWPAPVDPLHRFRLLPDDL